MTMWRAANRSATRGACAGLLAARIAQPRAHVPTLVAPLQSCCCGAYGQRRAFGSQTGAVASSSVAPPSAPSSSSAAPAAASSAASSSIPTVPFTSLPHPARSHTCSAVVATAATAVATAATATAASSASAPAPASVSLCGWLQSSRCVGSVWFGVLRDHTGVMQLQWSRDAAEAAGPAAARLFSLLGRLPLESVVRAAGCVQARPPGQANPLQGAAGRVELVLDSLLVLNVAAPQPISLEHEGAASASAYSPPAGAPPSASAAGGSTAAADLLRLQHRYVDLRRPWVQRLLSLRSRVSHAARRHLLERCDFTEVETPALFKSTPEGAAEFLVPTRTAGRFYALPQSPQQHKQMLMVGGVSRYFQIARCFRDEGSRADRQPEFTQIDLEMSFATQSDVMGTVEGMVQQVLQSTIGEQQGEGEGAGVGTGVVGAAASHPPPVPALPSFPLAQMSYASAMSQYGVDKPDLRYGLPLFSLSASVRSALQSDAQLSCPPFQAALQHEDGAVVAVRVPGLGAALSRKDLDTWQKELGKSVLVVRAGKDGELRTPALFQPLFSSNAMRSALGLSPGDLALVVASDSRGAAQTTLGRARIQAAHQMVNRGLLSISARRLDMVWVVDFPLFDCAIPTTTTESPVSSASSSSPPAPITLESIQLTAMHHPFTAAVASDQPLLEALLDELEQARADQGVLSVRQVRLTPGQLERIRAIRGQNYDLVCNGVELGGGSVRIHSAELQRRVLQLLGAPLHVFAHLLTALASGAPPHGGLALGMDRVVALLGAAEQERWNSEWAGRLRDAAAAATGPGASSTRTAVAAALAALPPSYGLSLPIRDVIAFPKTTSGRDIMVEAPSLVSASTLKQYHVQTIEAEPTPAAQPSNDAGH